MCTQPLHCSIHLTFPSFNIRCFSIKVISQAKGALCSANILGEQWMVIDQLKYLQGSHATVPTILHILLVVSVLQYLLSYLVLLCHVQNFVVQGSGRAPAI